MLVAGISLLTEFMAEHSDARKPLETWLAVVKEAKWNAPEDVKARFPKASIISNQDVVFNVRGNYYRLHVRISYKVGVVKIVRIGTHREYDKWIFEKGDI